MFILFQFQICNKKWDLKTPGRELEEDSEEISVVSSSNTIINDIVDALGGKIILKV